MMLIESAIIIPKSADFVFRDFKLFINSPVTTLSCFKKVLPNEVILSNILFTDDVIRVLPYFKVIDLSAPVGDTIKFLIFAFNAFGSL